MKDFQTSDVESHIFLLILHDKLSVYDIQRKDLPKKNQDVWFY